MFHVRPESGEPIYQQLFRQITHAITSGALKPGDRLPTIRQLAAEQVVNPNTVARAYRELERDGLVESGPRRGTFVTFDPPKLVAKERRSRLKPHLDGLVALSSGFMLTCMIWSSMTACLIDHRPRRALWWALAGAGFSFLGLIHTGTLSISGVVPVIGLGSGWPWTIGYALLAALYGLLSLRQPDTLAPAGDELA